MSNVVSMIPGKITKADDSASSSEESSEEKKVMSANFFTGFISSLSSFVTTKLIELNFVLFANCFVRFCYHHHKFGHDSHTPSIPRGRVSLML